MRVLSEVVRTRTVYGKQWEMQVVQIQSTERSRKHYGANPEHDGQFQATYFYGAEEKIWGEVAPTKEAAIELCDQMVELHFPTERMSAFEKAIKEAAATHTFKEGLRPARSGVGHQLEVDRHFIETAGQSLASAFRNIEVVQKGRPSPELLKMMQDISSMVEQCQNIAYAMREAYKQND